jgi:hypothetical protein
LTYTAQIGILVLGIPSPLNYLGTSRPFWGIVKTPVLQRRIKDKEQLMKLPVLARARGIEKRQSNSNWKEK